MLSALDAVKGHPAIYLMQLRKPRTSSSARRRAEPESAPRHYLGARLALGPKETTRADLNVCSGRVEFIGPPSLHRERGRPVVDLRGHLVLPGLINAHDHLEFGLYPNLGQGPYRNSQEWAQDIHNRHASLIEKHQSIPKDVRFWWGAIRNLLSGVTTVCHHNPGAAIFADPDFPVRVVERFGWAHSLAFDHDVTQRFQKTPSDQCFVLHVAEGVDAVSEREIEELDRLGVVNSQTVLVHGLALNADSTRLINRRDAAVVWCPSSNQFLFGKTLTTSQILSLRNVALGTDSPLTASGDLLDELKIAARAAAISRESLYRMVTTEPASILRLRDGEGRMLGNGVADFVAVRDDGSEPSERLLNLQTEEIGLIAVGGRIRLACDAVFHHLPGAFRDHLEPMDINGARVWVRAPLAWLFREARKVLGTEFTLGKKRVDYAGSASI